MRRRDFLALGALAGAAIATAASAAGPGETTVYIGTHTGGEGQGLFAAHLDEATGALRGLAPVAGIERPTWLDLDPHRNLLFSVSETGNDGTSHGSVYSLAIDPRSGALTEIGQADSGGGGATYLDYDATLSTVFVANYADGHVTAIPVGPGGKLAGVVSMQTNYGTGPSPRQKGPHAHAAVVDPTHRYLVSPDLGADRVFVYRIDPKTKKLSRGDPAYLQMPAGTGPRHLRFSRDGRLAFLDTELSGELYVLRWDAARGRLTPLSHVALDPADYTGTRSAAEILVSTDGRFLYASNRGQNLLQVFAIDRRAGTLRLVQKLPAGGEIPWSFGIDPEGRWLIATNEASSTLTVFAIDKRTGKLGATANVLSVPKPVALAFFQPGPR